MTCFQRRTVFDANQRKARLMAWCAAAPPAPRECRCPPESRCKFFSLPAAVVILLAGAVSEPTRARQCRLEENSIERRYVPSPVATVAATVVIDAMGADPPTVAKEPRFRQLPLRIIYRMGF